MAKSAINFHCPNMKVYVNASFLNIKPMTGLSRFALSMSLGLKKMMGNNVVFLLPSGPLVHPEISASLEAIQVGFNTKRTRWEQIDLPIYLKIKGSPILVNFGNTAPLYYSNQLVSILDIFYHRMGSVLKDNKNAYPWIEVQYYRFIVPRILKTAKTVLTISEYSKGDIEKYFKINSNKIEVVYPSIADSFFERKGKDFINKYGSYILGVSSVNPRKNFEGLIRAYKKAKIDDVKLVIVGEFSREIERYSLFNMFKDDGNIVFTGYVNDEELKGLYSNALFFVYPSFYEGFGIPPLEAMVCGCPTIVSNLTSLPEVCGNASLYVDPYIIDSIIEAMEKLYNSIELRRDLIKKGYERVKLYDKFESITKLVSIINTMNNVK